jgi:hypothetical protein
MLHADFEQRADLGDTAIMTMRLAISLLMSAGALNLGACDDAGSKVANKKHVPPLKCSIDTSNPGPLRRGGVANVEISGRGVSIKATKVNAWCGPLFNYDVAALNVKAGEGLLFETCLPDGIIQLSAYARPKGGEQSLHSTDQAAGVELLFNENGGPTYSSHGKWGDNIVLSPDLWKADAKVVLYDVATGAKLDAVVRFDCSGFKTGVRKPPVATRTDAGMPSAAAQ